MRSYIIFLLAITVILLPDKVFSQNFTALDPGFGVCEYPATAWCDIDNDGDLDVFFTGNDDSGAALSHLFINDGGGVFTEISTSIAGLSDAAASFGDMNNDGLADLAVTGFDGSSAVSAIYRNDGGGTFANIGAGLTNVYHGGIAWADYDNDGLFDLLICGETDAGNPQTILYHNDGGEVFSDALAGLTAVTYSSCAWSDVDLDGDMDLAINGENDSQVGVSIIYLNEDGTFSDMSAGLTGLLHTSIGWGDYNDDTYADLLLSGRDNTGEATTLIYKNNAGSSFTSIAGTYFGVSSGTSLWGDFTNDGALDIIVAGSPNNGGTPLPPPASVPLIYLYINQGSDVFTENQILLDVPNINSLSCGDYDDDSDLDLIVTGKFDNPISGNETDARLFRNEIAAVNNPPSAPTGLAYSKSGDEVLITWNVSTDDKTPADGLNYNMRLGTQSDNMNFLSALANLSSGYRMIVGTGNTSGNLSWSIQGLEFGEYYASVQAIDHNYEGSAFSDDLLITINPTATFSMVDSVCLNEQATVTYTGNASPAALYTWDFDGAVIVSGTGQGPFVIYWETEGIKVVSLTVTENGATSDPYSMEVLVRGYAPQPGAITGDTDICQGTISGDYFTDPLTGVITYEWGLNPPSAGTVSGNTILATVVWDAGFTGTAYLFVRATNACGTGPYSDSLLINVQTLPGQAAKPEGPEELCQNPDNTTYTTMGVPNALSFAWGIFPESAGEIINSGLEAEINWDDAFSGQAFLFVTASNLCGQGPTSDSISIEIHIPPVADAGDDQFVPSGTSTQLSGSASGGSGTYTYSWTPAHLLVDPIVANPVTLDLEQSVQFILEVTDAVTGCVGQDEVIITATGGILYLDVSSDPEEICEGEATQLLALGGGGSGIYTYTWSSSPTGFSSYIADPEAYPVMTTTYYAELDDGTDSVMDSTLVIVNPLPGTAGLISGPAEVCSGMELVYYSIDPVPNAIQYQWELPEGFFGNSDTTDMLLLISPIATVGGDIIVTPINACGMGTPSNLFVEVINVPPTPNTPNGNDSLCTTTNSSTNYSLLNPVPGVSEYDWFLLPEGSGNLEADGLTATINWTENWEGEAALSIRALNDCGYSEWSLPLTIYAYNCLGLPDQDMLEAAIKIFPNPSEGLLNIEFTTPDPTNDILLNIRDIYGRINAVRSIPAGQNKIQMNLESLPTGLYILMITNEGHLIAREKVIMAK